MTPKQTHFKIALPQEVKQFLEYRARQQERSMSAHIIYLLRQDMEKAPGHVAKQSPDAFKSHSEGNHCDDAE